MAEIEFIFHDTITIIQCDTNEIMKDICKRYASKIQKDFKAIYFIYNGKILNKELLNSFIQNANQLDKERKKMNLLVYETNIKKEKKLSKSKEIICPKCGKNINMKINNYKINLFDCKNGHNINISLKEFEKSQYIDESKIICDKCKDNNKLNAYNKTFYKCYKCNMNLCPLCKSNHDESHNIINYDLKNYICEIHNEIYISYCKECKRNICTLCLGHDNHDIIYYNKLISDKEVINKEKDELRKIIDRFNENIKDIINELNTVMENIEIYYRICENIINNYNIKNRNFEVLQNMKEIINKEIINDIKQIIKATDIKNKFNKIIDIYNKMKIEDKNELTKINLKNETLLIEKEKQKQNELNKEKENEMREDNENKNEIKIFDSKFVAKNINKCKFIYEGKEYDLQEYLNIGNKNDELLEIKLKYINNVTDMSYIFYNCPSLISLPDISGWNTNKIINMSSVFYRCLSLSNLNRISKWDTSNVTDMSFMFSSCYSLTSLPDISKWNLNNVNNMAYMFSNCNKLLYLPDISKWNTKM